jgi:hypothetical protein
MRNIRIRKCGVGGGGGTGRDNLLTQIKRTGKRVTGLRMD